MLLKTKKLLQIKNFTVNFYFIFSYRYCLEYISCVGVPDVIKGVGSLQ